MFFLLLLVVTLVGYLPRTHAKASLQHAARATNAQSNLGTTFISTDQGGWVSFSLNVVGSGTNAGDLYFHMEGSASKEWIAIGIGEGMKNALMFVVYADHTGHGVTLSPRLSTGQNEPSYTDSKNVTLLTDANLPNRIINSTYSVSALCKNCTKWALGSLDLSSASAPFIYAVGPDGSIDSSSPSADMRRHTVFGNFNMNMGLATSDQSRLPTVSKTEIGATQKGSPRVDHDYAILVHAIVMCVAFVLIIPFGVVLLRVLETVRWHAWNQAVAALLVVLGTAIGIYWSGTYNRSKKYNSAHQIIGIILVVAIVIQLSLGFFHHRLYKKHARPTLMGRIHRYLGPAVLFFGIVNGGTGLDLAGNATAGYIAAYVVVVVVVTLLVGGAIFMKTRQQRRKKASAGGDEGGFYRMQGNSDEGSNIGLKSLSRG